MRHLLFIPIFLLSFACFAQDSLITIHNFSSEFNNKSSKTDDGNYYVYLPLRMATDDKVIVTYTSHDIKPALVINDSLGDAIKKYGSKNSNYVMYFSSPYDMLYYFSFTGSKTGRFTARVYHYHKHADTITDKSTFNNKLHYIILNAETNFLFLEGTIKPNINLAGTDNTISLTVSPSYVCNYLDTTNKAAADTAYIAMQATLEKSLPGYFATKEEKQNESTVVYKLEGNKPDDLNNTHTFMNVQADVTLKYTHTKNKYLVQIIVN